MEFAELELNPLRQKMLELASRTDILRGYL